MHKPIKKLGVIGSSGFYDFPELKNIKKILINTKYGKPSDKITIGNLGNDLEIYFLPRHGKKHQLPPHHVPYKANLQALKQLGVNHVIGFCATGSLNKNIKPGDFVVLNQFVNFTWGRDDYFNADGKNFIHLPMSDPYNKEFSDFFYGVARKSKIRIHNNCTVVVIQGPRFSTMAESAWFSKQGWDVVNMTQYPECYFAKEMDICYAGIAMVTDFDIALKKYGQVMSLGEIDKIQKIFNNNVIRAKNIIQIISKELLKTIIDFNLPNNLKSYIEK